MPIDPPDDPEQERACPQPPSPEHWQTFPEMLQQLHHSGIFMAPDQLATYLLMHGLPVDLCYVPPHLQEKAARINDHYQGDMARLEDMKDPYWHPLIIIDGKEL